MVTVDLESNLESSTEDCKQEHKYLDIQGDKFVVEEIKLLHSSLEHKLVHMQLNMVADTLVPSVVVVELLPHSILGSMRVHTMLDMRLDRLVVVVEPWLHNNRYYTMDSNYLDRTQYMFPCTEWNLTGGMEVEQNLVENKQEDIHNVIIYSVDQ